jgi:intron-binding protein aquarius
MKNSEKASPHGVSHHCGGLPPIRSSNAFTDAFRTREELFPAFFEKVLDMFYDKSHTLTMQEKTIYLVFLINSFQSLEDPMVRKECLSCVTINCYLLIFSSLVSLPMWTNLHEERLKKELKSAPKVAKLWENFKSKDNSKDKKKTYEKKFLVDLIHDFVSILDSISDPGNCISVY